MKNRSFIFLSFVTLTLCTCSHKTNVIDLSGKWNVTAGSITQTAHLPRTLTENGIGIPVTDSSTLRLTQPVQYEGEAVFEKEIEIPRSWKGKCVELFMERTKVSSVFVNDSLIGVQNGVSAPHVYLIDGAFKSGINQIKITVNNNKKLLSLGGSHAYSDDTQTNWNGILGDFYLRCLDDIDVRNVRIDAAPDGKCSVRTELLNTSGQYLADRQLVVTVKDSSGNTVSETTSDIRIAVGTSFCTVHFDLEHPRPWDEYHPYLYRLEVGLRKETRVVQIAFGLRDFHTRSGKFTNNGRTVFLRGKHDGGVFPLTGYASMKKEDWLRYFSVARSYGINHVRFHSWTPPEAAFEAADETGVFLQPELPFWRHIVAEDTVLIDYMKAEGRRISEAYGNHPSFVMFSLGNELGGSADAMCEVIDDLKKSDHRHVYANGSNNFYSNPHPYPGEEYFTSMRHGKQASDNSTDMRGSFAFVDSKAEGGIINARKPRTDRNYARAIEGLTVPPIGHETGQYQIYPNFDEIKKYTGVMQPRNFEIFEKRLREAGMLSQAADFTKASGALSALCYREEIELALRTPGFGGFQLLDLQDYPGQGTALVGILDAFMDSKGVIEREKWREFCNDVVPLALFSKYCWTNRETFVADITVAHYGEKDLPNEEIVCTLTSADGRVLFEKTTTKQNIAQGGLTPSGHVEIPLSVVNGNQKLSFTVKLKNAGYQNSWNIWVYAPEKHAIGEGLVDGISVTRNKNTFDEAVRSGKTVLYIPRHADIKDRSVGGMFITDFWNYTMFRDIALQFGVEPSPGTLGILTDPQHALFRTFPTDFHTDWQWWNIVKHSRPMILNNYPDGYKPIVQVIDNFTENRKLGLIYEIPNAKGKALMCTSDLFAIKDEPEAKALFASMIDYLKGSR